MNEITNENTATNLPVIRSYKDRVFRMLFKGKEELLSLYNAVNNTDYVNLGDLEVNTLENAIYMSMKNDISFVLNLRLSLYEQQASVNPNMPLRDLLYIAKLYQTMIQEQNIYGRKRIKLPTPKFVVFYNGTEQQPEQQILKLSDAYEVEDENIALELEILVLNINTGYNLDLFRRCPLLHEYTLYVECVRKYSREFSLEKAVELAVEECISNNILKSFLQKNQAEVIEMSIFEYDEELHQKLFRQEGYEVGLEEGIEKGIEAFIVDNREEGIKEEKIIEKIQKHFQLKREQAIEYCKKY